jgi:hypothetical protein
VEWENGADVLRFGHFVIDNMCSIWGIAKRWRDILAQREATAKTPAVSETLHPGVQVVGRMGSDPRGGMKVSNLLCGTEDIIAS